MVEPRNFESIVVCMSMLLFRTEDVGVGPPIFPIGLSFLGRLLKSGYSFILFRSNSRSLL